MYRKLRLYWHGQARVNQPALAYAFGFNASRLNVSAIPPQTSLC
jgi:hypothetical protein